MTGLTLAFDTATDAVALGLGRRAREAMEVVSSATFHSPRRANSILLQSVRDQLADEPASITDVSEVVVGLGPGSFTGVRIGVATAKGLAHGLGVPLHGVPTLDAVAWRLVTELELQPGRLVGVLGDAMRGEVYPMLYRVTPWGPVRLGDDAVGKPQAVAEMWSAAIDEPAICSGNGLVKYAEIFSAALGERFEAAPAELWAPDGRSLLDTYLQHRQLGLHGDGDPLGVLPIYTRLSDAEENELIRSGAQAAARHGEVSLELPDAVRVRPMTASDVDAVLAIERASFGDAWTAGMFLDELDQPGRAWLVAEDGSGLVGYGGIARMPDEAHLMNLAVQAEQRRSGIGRRLLDMLVELAAEMGSPLLTLEVRATNTAAIRLYESVGMQVAGVRKRYYNDTGEDALIMWRDLAPTSAAPAEKCEGPSLTLAIETSCDETAAAVMRGSDELLANVVSSQIDFHARFGGVVPEIASRKHTEAIVGVVDEAMAQAGQTMGCDGPLDFSQLSAIAITHGPGLIGALVVGLAYAKGLSYATEVPLVGVNHLEGHIFANVLADPEVRPPLVALVVSGGHTSLVHMPEWGVYKTMGETLDDAAGEAFDKVAKVLGLGYPGGPILSRLAEKGDPTAIDFPRAMMRSGDYAFSLSGLKTAVLNYIRHETEAGREVDVPDLAASFQAAIVDVQVAKAVRAVQETGATSFCLAGGVAANPALREALRQAIEALGVHVSVPPFHLCTDNAAMIAAAAHYRFMRGERLGLDAEADASLRLDTPTPHI